MEAQITQLGLYYRVPPNTTRDPIFDWLASIGEAELLVLSDLFFQHGYRVMV